MAASLLSFCANEDPCQKEGHSKTVRKEGLSEKARLQESNEIRSLCLVLMFNQSDTTFEWTSWPAKFSTDVVEPQSGSNRVALKR